MVNRGKPNLPNVMVFCVALATVVIGVATSHTHAPSRTRRSPQARTESRPARPPDVSIAAAAPSSREPPTAKVTPPPVAKPMTPPPTSRPPVRTMPKTVRQVAVLPPTPLARSPERRFAAKGEDSGRGPVPPLLPPLYGPELTTSAIATPQPAVLRLTGVVEGTEKLAIIRRGVSRYMVREGDTIDNYRVVKIRSTEVTLQRGSRKRSLRLAKS